jgi:hypothetical protein
MKAKYLNVLLSSCTRDWYKKWFYVQQEQVPFVACDVAQIPKQQESWSARPSSTEMVQVEEHSDGAVRKLQRTIDDLMGQIKVRALEPQSCPLSFCRNCCY